MKSSFEVPMNFFRKIHQFFISDFLHSKFPKSRWICGMSRIDTLNLTLSVHTFEVKSYFNIENRLSLRDTLIKTGDDKNYVWTKVGPNPSRIHKTTKNMILYKNLMFIFSFV